MAKESFHILRGVCDAQVVTAVKTDFKAWRKVKVETRRGRRKEDRRHGWMDGWMDGVIGKKRGKPERRRKNMKSHRRRTETLREGVKRRGNGKQRQRTWRERMKDTDRKEVGGEMMTERKR